MRTSGFIVLTGWAIELLEQFGIDDSVTLTLFCHIHALTSNEGTRGGYDGTLNTLAYWTRSKSKNRVSRALEKLVTSGLILKETRSQNNIIHCTYRSNLNLIDDFLRTDSTRIQNGYTISKMNTPHIQNEYGGISKMNTGHIQNEYGGVYKIDTHKKKEENKAVKEKREKKERENAPAHSCEDDHTARLIEKAMEPESPARAPFDFEVPTAEMVEHALRNFTVRPPENEISLCAGYFIDRMEREEWKTRDWRNALRRYAQRWIVRGNAGRMQKPEPTKPSTPPPPPEWTTDAEPTPFQIWPIELGGTIEKNEDNLRRYLDAEVLDWEAEHGRRVSWRQAEDWKEKLFAPLYRRLEKERNGK